MKKVLFYVIGFNWLPIGVHYYWKSSSSDLQNDNIDSVNTKKILLTACDKLREDLKHKGIQLKVGNYVFSL